MQARRHRPVAIDCNSLIAARALLLGSDRAMLLSEQQARHELAAGELIAYRIRPVASCAPSVSLRRPTGSPRAAQRSCWILLRAVARPGRGIDQ